MSAQCADDQLATGDTRRGRLTSTAIGPAHAASRIDLDLEAIDRARAASSA
jgi:hypothetical protein